VVVMQVELTEKHRSLIENIVRNNPRFTGNEDLVDDFCSETFKRAYSVASSCNSVKNLEIYLNKVASTAILEVLINSGRLRKSKVGYHQIQQKFSSSLISYELDENENIVFDIPDPNPSLEEKIIQQDEAKTVRNVILQIDSKEQHKKYLEIFVLKYLKGLSQSEIAREIGVSQGEVSKRITELAKKVNRYLK
jgi:RNA polymerase sigma factor (sigma-70 family)